MVVVTFDDKEQLEAISNLANWIEKIYGHSAVATISETASILRASKEQGNLDVELSDNHEDNDDYNEVKCLFYICKLANNIGADEVNAGIDMYQKLKPICVKSDVPRFLHMLKEFNVDPHWCRRLFSDWCSTESLGQIALDCMEIQVKQEINMTHVYHWCSEEEPNADTNYKQELEVFDKEVN